MDYSNFDLMVTDLEIKEIIIEYYSECTYLNLENMWVHLFTKEDAYDQLTNKYSDYFKLGCDFNEDTPINFKDIYIKLIESLNVIITNVSTTDMYYDESEETTEVLIESIRQTVITPIIKDVLEIHRHKASGIMLEQYLIKDIVGIAMEYIVTF
jgi:hypothetical protein